MLKMSPSMGKEKLAKRVCVVGFGKVGSALVASYLKAGFTVDVIEENPVVAKELKENTWATQEPDVTPIIRSLHQKIRVNHLEQAVKDCRFFMVIVPTPSLLEGSFDDSIVKLASENLFRENVEDSEKRFLVVKSTVSPGSCRKLQAAADQISPDAHWSVIYNPEFIALGSIMRDLMKPNISIAGSLESSDGNTVLDFSRNIGDPQQRSVLGFEAAEIAKIAVNTFITAKISFANLIGDLAQAYGVEDPKPVLSTIGSDPRIGNSYLKPGLGFGGPCFPRDNKALGAALLGKGLENSLPKSIDEVNQSVPDKKLKLIRSKSASSILFVGLAYKPGSDFIGDSQACQIAEKLHSLGHNITAVDQFVDSQNFDFPVLGELPNSENTFDMVVLAVADEILSAEVRKKYDPQIIMEI